ncbi:CHASE2 domain-containing protein [Methylocapsa palsarum]|uniref:Adenylate cyclase n=1 Tax=Methylocapsa palsarum TaxID=1612308 RepID=A0A1I3YR09_9HYPH|nr:adenylate/guanylate cyclase domain-containing protein [Methylocapsa palsarum]SFK33809.1 adenylate cyclase [Methylocapsa palsarum]
MKAQAIAPGTWITIALALATGLAWSANAGGMRDALRENALDLVSASSHASSSPRIVVVDIDSPALRQYGPWPWGRLMLARLVDAVIEAKPLVVGLDMLLAGEDRLSPSAIARRLATQTARSDLAAIAGELADGDLELGHAFERSQTVLGAVLTDEPEPKFRASAPILVRGAPRLLRMWSAKAAIGPLPQLARSAAGVGLIVFENDPDGVARRVPLLALAGGETAPGFAVEIVRVAEEASTLVIDGAPPRLRIGGLVAPLGVDAMLRFRASSPGVWPERTLSATRILEGRFDAAAIRDSTVLIGSSAPEVGILRRTAKAEAAPTVQIEADAIATLLSGKVPMRPSYLSFVETAGATALGLLSFGASLRLRPARGLLVVCALASGWAAAAVLLLRWRELLLDPAGPPVVALSLFALCGLSAAIQTERRERRLRQRFEQHLAPAIVARILARPNDLRLEGESREVTALFTDIEGFTAMTERSQPRELIALLDAYYQLLADIVVAHGGMVDKIVGDAILALFNAPLDLPCHPQRAVECAVALRDATEAFRERPQAQALGLGRTRIGLETGFVIIGDVGGRRKLDYTAHGMAINTAARLEAANKELGTSICIGPVAASRLPPGLVRSVGKLMVRGRSDELEVFEPLRL